jgi:hypothetical protein
MALFAIPSAGRRDGSRSFPAGSRRRSAGAASLALFASLLILAPAAPAAGPDAGWTEARFRDQIQPILEDHCYACHADGINKGGMALDQMVARQDHSGDIDRWWAVLKNVRAGMMPPPGKPRPDAEEQQRLESWIKYGAFGIDPSDPDPGRVTVRRLNRNEYRNTVRELLGVDYNTTEEFPPDDSGYGFDNIGDVLTLSPLLLEKYITAAKAIIAQAVPTSPRVVKEIPVSGNRFRKQGEGEKEKEAASPSPPGRRFGGGRFSGGLPLSYYEPAKVSNRVRIEQAGHYQLVLDLSATERYVDGVFDYNKCRLVFKADGEELLRREYSRQAGQGYRYEFDRDWKPGEHEMTFELEPLTKEKQVRSLSIRINAVTVRGPFDEKFWVRPPGYERIFPRDVPDDRDSRRAYARELLGRFATRAFRRPVDDATIDRLVAAAEHEYTQPGRTFEAGIARGMTIILSSPRFLFREEGIDAPSSGRFPPLDEYALASRLSYFLWSSMPDDELFRLAAEHRLRAELPAQVRRMLADHRSAEFFRHFTGQWLQARDVETVLVNAFAVLSHDQPRDPKADRHRARFRELSRKPADRLTDKEKDELKELRSTFVRSFRRFREFELTGELRRAMRRETEMLLEHIVKNDRSLLEVIDCDYTFLNEPLAKYYGIEGVQGNEMQRVSLPKDSPRGGVLTQGTMLTVTSNPDRTSPVKRGLFILENILGTPPPPPPPNLPTLEEAGKKLGPNPTLRQSLALHREMASCASCHNRMDPLGLALENFNALGRWRDKEAGKPIDAAGTLVTGETFNGIRELKQILTHKYRRDYYRCLTEKLLTYALGRGLDAGDVETVDRLVDRLEKEDGRPSALLLGIIESTPFQRRRRENSAGGERAPADRKTASGHHQPNLGG